MLTPPISPRGIKRSHSTFGFDPETGNIYNGFNDGQAPNDHRVPMRRIAATPLLRGKLAPRAGKPTNPNTASYPNRVQRTPISKPRRSPISFTYRSETSLDPATLDVTPDAVAVREIKKAIPVIPRTMNGQPDVVKMISLMIASAMSTQLPETLNEHGRISNEVSAQMTHVTQRIDTPGADFDKLLDSLTDSGLVNVKLAAVQR